MASLEPSGNYGTVFYITTSGSEETAYTVPDAYPAVYIQQIRCVDDGGAARTISITVRQTGSGTAYYVAGLLTPIPALAWLDLEFDPLVINKGGIIKVIGSAAGIHIQISFVQLPRGST